MANKNKKKILFVATVGSHISLFHMNFIRHLLQSNYIVDASFHDDTDKRPGQNFIGLNKIWDVEFDRSPYSLKNIATTKKLKEILFNGHYDIVHCNTPVGSVVARIAASEFRKSNGLKVIYTAHGFHFFKGAPLKNWLLFYPVEWLCARLTDVLITINKEDYARAKKHLHANSIEYVPGVGIDVEKFKKVKVDIVEKRKELGLPCDAKVILSVGELNKNKNHQLVIKALAKIDDKNLHYLIVGTGNLDDYLTQLADRLGMSNQLHLAGYRDDIAEIYKASDFYIHPSFREGLPVAPMEAIASGLPVLLSDIRGCRDLCDSDLLFNPKSATQLSDKIIKYLSVHKVVPRKSLESFSEANVNQKLMQIYKRQIT